MLLKHIFFIVARYKSDFFHVLEYVKKGSKMSCFLEAQKETKNGQKSSILGCFQNWLMRTREMAKTAFFRFFGPYVADHNFWPKRQKHVFLPFFGRPKTVDFGVFFV
jgi:hypothetical protein